MYREVKKPELLGIAVEWNRAELEREFDRILNKSSSSLEELILAMEWTKTTPLIATESV
jgi:hypothetical protein